MTSFDPLLRIDCLREEAVASVHNHILNWIESEPFRKLKDAFDWEDDSSASLTDRIHHLVKESDDWDFRRKSSAKETTGEGTTEGTRWTSRDDSLTEEQKRLALEAGDYFSISSASKPNHANYKAVLVLGGAKLSCLLRTRYAANLLRGDIQAQDVVLLGSERNVMESEREATDTYAPSAQTEFDLFVAAASQELDTGSEPSEAIRHNADNPNSSWKVLTFDSELSDRVLIVSAPSTQPETRRANSSDTYLFYLQKNPTESEERFLLVTSPIYVPYQQLEALRVLGIPHELKVETVGFPPTWGIAKQGMQEPQHYLQEIRSFLQSSERFLHSYPES